jgi:hypothetical protein
MRTVSRLVASQPRSVGALFAATVAVYRRYPLLFPTLAAAVIVPYHLVVLAATGHDPGAEPRHTIASYLAPFVEVVLISPLVSALHVHGVADIHRGQDPKIRSVAVRGIKALPVVALVLAASSLGIGLGFLLLIVPGVILYLNWFVIAQAAAIEDGGWGHAFDRSEQLTRQRRGHVLRFALVLFVVAAGGAEIIYMTLLGDRDTAPTFLGGVAVHIATASFTALATALLYYDLRAREEAEPERVGPNAEPQTP